MSFFEVALKILGSAWGVGSMVALLAGIFFWITAKAIRKAKPGSLAGEVGADFLRSTALLALLFAAAALVVASVREFQTMAILARQERIRGLVLELKSADPTQSRQALEALVPYGSDAARELVKAIGEEATVEAAESVGKATSSGPLDLFLSTIMGAPPWETPFFDAAVDCLARIGEPAVPPIFDQLAAESERVERLLAEAGGQQQLANPNLLEVLEQFKWLFGAAGGGLRAGIVRDVLKQALLEIGQPAIPALLKGAESPRLFVQLTSYEVLSQMPGVRQTPPN